MTSSLNFTNGFFEFDLGIPLLITTDIAPAYPLFSAGGTEFDMANGLFDGIGSIASSLDASFLDNAGDLLTTANANLVIALDGSTIISAPVSTPEPSTVALLGGGLVGLAILCRRRSARRVDPDP
jgi:hypothetical protein